MLEVLLEQNILLLLNIKLVVKHHSTIMNIQNSAKLLRQQNEYLASLKKILLS